MEYITGIVAEAAKTYKMFPIAIPGRQRVKVQSDWQLSTKYSGV